MRPAAVPHVLLAAALLAALPAGRAAAADLDYGYGQGYGSVPAPVAESKVEFGSGWYVRGDIGLTSTPGVIAGDESYDTGRIGNAVTSGAGTCATQGATPNCYYNNANAYNRSVFAGPTLAAPAIATGSTRQIGYDASLGAGYQINRFLRVDATFDFLKPQQSSYRGASVPCITGTAALPPPANGTASSENIISASCTPNLNASLKSYGALINGYVDLGHVWRVTPYVGAGVGLSFGYASASSTYYQNNGVAYQISYSDALSGSSFYQNWNRSQSTNYYNFAFALMGGIAIDVYDHTKLDIGYRYLHLGQVLGTTLATQQVRAGLRYMIDN